MMGVTKYININYAMLFQSIWFNCVHCVNPVTFQTTRPRGHFGIKITWVPLPFTNGWILISWLRVAAQASLHQWSSSSERSDHADKSWQGGMASEWTARVWKAVNERDGLLHYVLMWIKLALVWKDMPQRGIALQGRPTSKYCLFKLDRSWIINSWKCDKFCWVITVWCQSAAFIYGNRQI